VSDWPIHSLGELIGIKHGFAFKSKHFVEEETGLVLVTPGNFAIGGGFKCDKPKWYDADGPLPSDYVLSPGSLIVTMTDLSVNSDTLGYSAVIPNDDLIYLHNQRIGLVDIHRPEVLDQGFLHYVMRSDHYRRQIIVTASGSTVHHTSPGRIRDATIPIPPLPIQRRIAGILGALDDKIEVNRRINRTLEAMAQALFKHWFVDFGPFQDGEFVDSELGMIPKGWRVIPLSSVVELLSGGTPKTSVVEYWGGSVKWVSAGDVNSAQPFITSTQRTITSLGLQHSSARELPAFTTVITARGTVGQCGLLADEMAINQTNYGLRGKGALGAFATFLLVTHTVQLLRQRSYGTVFDTITRATFDKVSVFHPPREVWMDFEDTVRPWFLEMLANQRESGVLTATRDYLLPRLLSGEIPVAAAEEAVGR
jgi:type I restriction enzyme, S subunit